MGDIEQSIRKLVSTYALAKAIPNERIDIQYKDAIYAMEMKTSVDDGLIRTDTFETKKRNWIQSLLSYSGPYILFYKRLPKPVITTIDVNKVVNTVYLDTSINASSAFTTAVKGVLELLTDPPTLPILYTYENVSALESDTVSEVTMGYRIEPETGRRLKYECYVYDNPSYNPQYLDPNTAATTNSSSSTSNPANSTGVSASNVNSSVNIATNSNNATSSSGSKQHNKYYPFFYVDNIRKLYAKKTASVNRGLGMGVGTGVGGGLGGLKSGGEAGGVLLGADDYSISLVDHYDFSMGVWTHTAQKVLATWNRERGSNQASQPLPSVPAPALQSPFSASFQEYYVHSHFYSYLKGYRIYSIKNLEVYALPCAILPY